MRNLAHKTENKKTRVSRMAFIFFSMKYVHYKKNIKKKQNGSEGVKGRWGIFYLDSRIGNFCSLS